MKRLNTLLTKLATVNQQAPESQSVMSNVQFNAFAALTKSKFYNALGRMRQMLKGRLIHMQYQFSATASEDNVYVGGEEAFKRDGVLERRGE